MSDYVSSEQASTPLYSFGLPWPEYNEGIRYTDTIKSADNGLKLIEFYSTKYKSSGPLQGWLQRIRNGQIMIDGEVVTDPDTILRVRSRVVYHRVPWKEPDVQYVIEVLYEDDDMVALNKPSGLQVLPGGTFQQRTVLKQLEWNFRKGISLSTSSMHMMPESHPVPTHRLGRGTSGVLLCAKTKFAKTFLAEYFANGMAVAGSTVQRRLKVESSDGQRISKVYRAIVTGILEADEIVIDQPIGVMCYPGVASGLYVASSSGKPALSKVHVLERNVEQNRTLVKVKIHSGRPHQIRIHLAFIGHPLLGDPLYDIGGNPKMVESGYVDETYAEDGGYQKPIRPVPGDCGYHLHAHQVVLRHPSANKIVEITAQLPSILQTTQELGQSCS